MKCNPMAEDFSSLIGSKIYIPGHFSKPVLVERIEPLGNDSWFVQVRTFEGKPDETVLTN